MVKAAKAKGAKKAGKASAAGNANYNQPGLKRRGQVANSGINLGGKKVSKSKRSGRR